MTDVAPLHPLPFDRAVADQGLRDAGLRVAWLQTPIFQQTTSFALAWTRRGLTTRQRAALTTAGFRIFRFPFGTFATWDEDPEMLLGLYEDRLLVRGYFEPERFAEAGPSGEAQWSPWCAEAYNRAARALESRDGVGVALERQYGRESRWVERRRETLWRDTPHRARFLVWSWLVEHPDVWENA